MGTAILSVILNSELIKYLFRDALRVFLPVSLVDIYSKVLYFWKILP